MRNALIAIVIAAVTLGNRARPGDPPIDLQRARACFDHARMLSQAEGGRLWGVELYGPMLFVDPATRFVVANLADGEGALTESDGVYTGTLPAEVGIANTAVHWAGEQWTMLIWPLPENRYRRGRLLAHEMYHRVQDDIGLPATTADCGHLDSRDGRIWMRLEWRALAEALIRRDAARRAALEDALAFRARRHALFPDGVERERALEMNEGLAEYTGFRACGLPEHVLADRAAIQLEEYEQRPTFVRNFAYASGPAYGILLDESGAAWRENLSSESDLGMLLAEAYGYAGLPAFDDQQLRDRAQRYEGDRVIADETRRDAARQARQAAFQKRFEQNPTLRVPAAENLSYSFNPNAVEAFSDVGTVYLTASIRDDWGELVVESGGALMIRDERGRVAHFIVPAPQDVNARPIEGDGWTLTLNDGWTLSPDGSGGYTIEKKD